MGMLKVALALVAMVIANAAISGGVTAAVLLSAPSLLCSSSATAAGANESKLTEILTAAKTAPVGIIRTYKDYFSMPISDLSNIKTISYVVPLDWECQSRTTSGPQPCANGVPAKCRYYHFEEFTDQCVQSYCSGNSPSLGSLSAGDPSVCCNYFSWLGSAPVHYAGDPAVVSTPGYGPSGDSFFDGYAGIPTTAGTTIDQSLATQLSNDAATCDEQLELLHTTTWGYDAWWLDPLVARDALFNYMNMKIARYEYAPTNGLMFFASAGDVMHILRDGSSFFMPKGYASSDLMIPLNETLEVVPVAATRRRLSATDEGRAGALNDPHVYHREMKEYHADRFTGSGHPLHGFRAREKISKLGSAKMLAQQEGGGEHGRKLGFFSALMTSGSFTMMQAGSF